MDATVRKACFSRQKPPADSGSRWEGEMEKNGTSKRSREKERQRDGKRGRETKTQRHGHSNNNDYR